MQVTETILPGVKLIQPKIFQDERGFFCELSQGKRFAEFGLPELFVQNNFSHSLKNVVRGLHYQLEKPQGKLVYVAYGEVIDIVADVRPLSKTFGKVFSVKLTAKECNQVYIPPGYAHGFSVLSETAGFIYQCTDYYHPGSEHGIAFNDPLLNIDWQVSEPILSVKDAALPFLKNIPNELLPQ